MQRHPAVAGQFYPGQSAPLLKMVEGFLAPALPGNGKAIGIVSPHAGYIYSGRVAGETFASVAVPESVVILGPNHRGHGSRAALFARGSWLSPLGEVNIDEELADSVLRHCPVVTVDEGAHLQEHSLEVQVPFIQARSPKARIVPLCLGMADLKTLLSLGEGLAEALKEGEGETLLVASSDMTHYEPAETARRKDMLAIDHILALDPEGLYGTVRDEGISMCGVVPTVVMLAAARKLGARQGRLVRYANSGEVSGEFSEVVGYAGVVID